MWGPPSSISALKSSCVFSVKMHSRLTRGMHMVGPGHVHKENLMELVIGGGFRMADLKPQALFLL